MSIFKKMKKSAPKMEDDSSDVKPSLAVAFSAQRHSKKQKMALGGAVQAPSRSIPYDRNPGTPAKKPDNTRLPENEYMNDKWSMGDAPARKPDNTRLPMDEYMADHFAEGGVVDSIAEAIMRKMSAKRMAEGGMVDLDANSEEQPNQLDGMNEDAANAEQYDLGQLSAQPEDSNESGDADEKSAEDDHDMVSAIRKKMQAKKGR